MTGLPTSIESYLSDAGFSLTELTVLRKLLEGEALTLRELAAKTGKSTGVLDQAVKKLLQRRIIVRETVNDTPKMLLKSLGAILQWVKEDTERKLALMKSRAQDFESFVASLTQESVRPEMEYFEGPDGIQKAYMKLLDLKVKEFLHYRSVTVREEEDPLASFRVQYFRERHRRGIFSRVLVPETSLGRRFQSRDPFEYRKTALLPEAVFQITFEKIIAGDTIACFHPSAHSVRSGSAPLGSARGSDHSEERACFISFPELARSEREMFELLWRRATEPPSQPQTVALTLPSDPQPLIPFGTRTFSSLREFFLSRKSVALFTVCAVLAAGVTYGLWRHTYNLNRDRVKERAMAIAATAAMEFDTRDIDQLHIKKDVEKPEFMKLVEHLRLIRSNNENIKFVYIDRPTGMENPSWEVVADADYGTPDEDFNGNGIIEDFEQLTMPGQAYPYVDPFFHERLQKPVADFLKDEWGEYCDASAPIFDSQGKAVAVLFVDIDLQQVRDLTSQSIQVAYVFLGLFLLFVFVRLAAFNQPLFFELLRLLKSRAVPTILAICALIALGVTYGMYRYSYNLSLQRVREQVMAIAATAAPEFDAEDLDQLHTWRDAEKPVYRKVVEQLQDIRKRNAKVKAVYIERGTETPYVLEYVADADFPDIHAWRDLNGDGLRNDVNFPGYRYFWDVSDYPEPRPSDISVTPYADRGPYTDIWGTWISGSAPIRDRVGKIVAEVGVDIDASEVDMLTRQSFRPFLVFLGLFLLFVFIRLAAFNRMSFVSLLKLLRRPFFPPKLQ